MKKPLKLTMDVEIKCPFCGGMAAMGTSPEPAIVHSVPPCERFIHLDAIEFVKHVKTHYQEKEEKKQ